MKFLRSSIKGYRISICRCILNKRLKNKSFSIISNDCWGGEVYKSLNLKYTTPFVGLMIMSPCYIKLLENLHHYMEQPLLFKESSKYDSINNYKKKIGKNFPIGVLGDDIETQFLHYNSNEEAYDKWTRRSMRINWNNVFIKYDSNKDLASEEHLKSFDLLAYSKVAFGISNTDGIKSLVLVNKWTFDAVTFFYISLKFFDVIDWLNGGDGKITLVGRLNYYLFLKCR